MKILKRWYFEWLDEKYQSLLSFEVRNRLGDRDIKEDIDYWVKHHSQNCIHYRDFVSALCNDSKLVEEIVSSINRKQIK